MMGSTYSGLNLSGRPSVEEIIADGDGLGMNVIGTLFPCEYYYSRCPSIINIARAGGAQLVSTNMQKTQLFHSTKSHAHVSGE